ncbi:hypothetical protein TRFO_06877 [Tritrichomonas foetus]|uniref:Myb-like DNA-binding domain containing protein n=1 Tax=Tritrichomonas foetus TaxID=1144522 RepID=A0A1J4JUL5_9EUKA|nr:hypothetical protein TRFO_06877 [Tritrichomonas foetus]|eukprot:OHT02847.1 hypothetical protein TRFO_06877 [Tritrichomonas foetus]
MFCSFKAGPKNNYEYSFPPSSPESLTGSPVSNTLNLNASINYQIPNTDNHSNNNNFQGMQGNLENQITSFHLMPKCNSITSQNGISTVDNSAASVNKPVNLVDSISAQWAREKPRSSLPRNVGGTKKNKWTASEDALLAKAIEEFGTESWRDVATHVPGRTGKQCRERWLSHMSPSILREEWTPQEDLILLHKQADLGNRWSIISKSLPGRSTTAVKNRWNYLCRRDIPNHSEEFEKKITEVMSTSTNFTSTQEAAIASSTAEESVSNSSSSATNPKSDHPIATPILPAQMEAKNIPVKSIEIPLLQFDDESFQFLANDFSEGFFNHDAWNELDQIYADLNPYF